MAPQNIRLPGASESLASFHGSLGSVHLARPSVAAKAPPHLMGTVEAQLVGGPFVIRVESEGTSDRGCVAPAWAEEGGSEGHARAALVRLGGVPRQRFTLEALRWESAEGRSTHAPAVLAPISAHFARCTVCLDVKPFEARGMIVTMLQVARCEMFRRIAHISALVSRVSRVAPGGRGVWFLLLPHLSRHRR